MPTSKKSPIAKYYVNINKYTIDYIPIIVSKREVDLYNACSTKHRFRSSLTFDRGEPIESDIHGAEATLAAYVKLGTIVAYIPERLNYMAKFSPPPWAAREFIHLGETSYRKQPAYVPQPAYGVDETVCSLLQDAVDWILFRSTETGYYATCENRYEGVYVDVETRMPITEFDINKIRNRWGVEDFMLRVKQ